MSDNNPDHQPVLISCLVIMLSPHPLSLPRGRPPAAGLATYQLRQGRRQGGPLQGREVLQLVAAVTVGRGHGGGLAEVSEVGWETWAGLSGQQ